MQTPIYYRSAQRRPRARFGQHAVGRSPCVGEPPNTHAPTLIVHVRAKSNNIWRVLRIRGRGKPHIHARHERVEMVKSGMQRHATISAYGALCHEIWVQYGCIWRILGT